MVFIAVLFFNDVFTSAGLGLVAYLFLLFLERMGKTFPVLELMLLIAGLQWILGAYFGYIYQAGHFKYFMYVPQEEYMQFVVPAMFLFVIGVHLFYPRYSFAKIHGELVHLAKVNTRLPLSLILIGLLCQILSTSLPANIGFVLYLMGSFQYVGLILLILSNHRTRWGWFILIMGLLLFNSVIRGVFHDLLLWSVLISTFLILNFRTNAVNKSLFLFLGMVIIFFIQSVKGEYRKSTSELGNVGRVNLFTTLIFNELTNIDVLLERSYLSLMNVRLNQGWIISAIMYQVPATEPYANGETIVTAVSSSLTPRILVPDKKKAGGQENFERFTGLPLRKGTSMGTSIIGEAYANFGVFGGCIFMLLWGSCISLIFSLIVNMGKKRPIIYIFLPLIFLQVIKAETELAVVLNHLTKALILVFVFLWFSKNVLGWYRVR